MAVLYLGSPKKFFFFSEGCTYNYLQKIFFFCYSRIVFSVRWRKNIFLLLLFWRKEEEFWRPPPRSRQRKKHILFLPLLFLERRILKKFPSILSKKRVGYKKNPKLFCPKRRRKICSLNFHCSKKKKKKKEIFTSILLRRKKDFILPLWTMCLLIFRNFFFYSRKEAGKKILLQNIFFFFLANESACYQ